MFLTLIKSRGCPTKTVQAPPTPPDRKLLRADSAVEAVQKKFCERT